MKTWIDRGEKYPVPSLSCSPLPRSPPSLPSRRRLHHLLSTRRPTRPSLPDARGAAAGAAVLGPAGLGAGRRHHAPRAVILDRAQIFAPPPLLLLLVLLSLSHAATVARSRGDRRRGQEATGCRDGLELLGRWRRPSWFVMEAAPPASWLRLLLVVGCKQSRCGGRCLLGRFLPHVLFGSSHEPL